MTEDLDKPPAGTWCCVCRATGHFCQAEVYTAGDSGNAICAACQRMEDCPVTKLRSRQAGAGAVAGPDVFNVPRVSAEERSRNRAELIADLLRRGMTVRQVCYEEGFSSEEVRAVRQTIPELRKKERGEPGKNDKRARAAGLLKAGEPLDVVVDRVGLCRATVLGVKNEIMAELPARCKCGAAFGHWGKCKEVSMEQESFEIQGHVRRTFDLDPYAEVAPALVASPEPPVLSDAPHETITDEPRRGSKWYSVFNRLLTLGVGGKAELTVPPDDTPVHYANCLRASLSQNAKTTYTKWSVSVASPTVVIVARLSLRSAFPKGAVREQVQEERKRSPRPPLWL